MHNKFIINTDFDLFYCYHVHENMWIFPLMFHLFPLFNYAFSKKKMNINWSEYWKLFNFLHFLPIGKSIDEKSKKDTFDGSRKVINAAMDRICEYTGKSLQPYLLSCKSNFFDYCIGLIFNLQELKSSSGIWECLLWTTYINPVSQALGWMYL